MPTAGDAKQRPTSSASTNKLAGDVGALLFNVSSSVLIIFVNKHLMLGSADYAGFTFASTLCALHFLTCALYTSVLVMLGSVRRVSVPLKDLFVFAGVGSLSIVSLNLSLMLNTVGLYQMSKLLIIPFVAVVEYLWYTRQFTHRVVAALTCVVAGVGMLTVTGDVGIGKGGIGLIMAAISVASSGMQQLLCRHVQKVNNISSQELLAASTPIQGAMLIVVGPFIDLLITKHWVLEYAWTTTALGWLVASCVVAVAVNLSQFLVLGRFTALTFQVMGHLKTLLVLLGGFLLFHESASGKQLAAIALAVGGMIWYGSETSKQESAGKASKGKAVEQQHGDEEAGKALLASEVKSEGS